MDLFIFSTAFQSATGFKEVDLGGGKGGVLGSTSFLGGGNGGVLASTSFQIESDFISKYGLSSLSSILVFATTPTMQCYNQPLVTDTF